MASYTTCRSGKIVFIGNAPVPGFLLRLTRLTWGGENFTLSGVEIQMWRTLLQIAGGFCGIGKVYSIYCCGQYGRLTTLQALVSTEDGIWQELAVTELAVSSDTSITRETFVSASVRFLHLRRLRIP